MAQETETTTAAGAEVGLSGSSDLLEDLRLELSLALCQRLHARQAATSLARALQDMFNDIGELPDVREHRRATIDNDLNAGVLASLDAA